MSNEREEFQKWRIDFDSDRNWEAVAHGLQAQLESAKSENAKLRQNLADAKRDYDYNLSGAYGRAREAEQRAELAEAKIREAEVLREAANICLPCCAGSVLRLAAAKERGE